MPELPEVETIMCGIKPHVLGRKISSIIVRQQRLRWPVPEEIQQCLTGQTVKQLSRRNKYMLFQFAGGTLILHLGMSGRLSILPEQTPPKKHDHIDIIFNNHTCLRFTDPRRFGALLWTEQDVEQHPLLAEIGPEPLTGNFDGDHLWQRSRGRKAGVKAFIMDGRIVAGVGNIYATEALFAAGIRPQTPAGKLSRAQYQLLAAEIKAVLRSAIAKGGTTLRDFARSDGSPGYFQIELRAYGREGQPCVRCKRKLKSLRIGQRSSVYCPHCQK